MRSVGGRRRSSLAPRTRSRSSPLAQSRRGVLLLVVLSMLVLFMLIGTAFLMSSSSVARLGQESVPRPPGSASMPRSCSRSR